jgi:hypothetical protein
MRLREFLNKLNEDGSAGISSSADDTGSVDTGAQSGKKKGRGKVHSHHAAAIKGLTTIPDWPGYYYNMYRLGVHLAGSPENPNEEKGAFANEMVFTTYTDVEEKMLKHSAKEMGVNLLTLSSNKSKETDDTNKSSPVAKRKPNKYGI